MIEGFIHFLRKQGVVGLAVGFILGGAISKLVSAIVVDVVSPLLGIVLSRVGPLQEATISVAGAVIRWGDLVSSAIDFIVIAAVVYFVVHGAGLDKLDAKDSA